MMNVTDLIVNYFSNKISDIQATAQKEICELETQKKAILFIVNDLENGPKFGTKYGDGIGYEITSPTFAKKAEVEQINAYDISDYVKILRTYGFQVEVRKHPSEFSRVDLLFRFKDNPILTK